MNKKIQFRSIKKRLTFWFLMVALVPLIIVSAVIYNQMLHSIKMRTSDKLTTIRDFKEERINWWLEDNAMHIEVIANDDEIKILKPVFQKNEYTPEDRNLFEHIRQNHLIRYMNDFKDFFEIFIINAYTGKVDIGTNKLMENQDRSKRPYFTEPLKTGQTFISDIYYSKELHEPTMVFSAPFYSHQNNRKHSDEKYIIGIIVARVDLKKSLYALLLDQSGMGETGEAIIVNKDAFALNELRWHPDAPLKFRMENGSALPASRGNTGIAEAKDYRGEKVLTAYTFLPGMQWGFVVKQDLEEIYSPMRVMLRNILIFFLLSTVGVYLIVIFITKTISQPVLELTEVAQRIEKGEISARNQMKRSDEFGYLADAFDNMADSIMSQMVIKQGNAEMTETMVSAQHLKNFGKQIIQKLLYITESHLGAFYIQGDDGHTFHPFASIGVSSDLQQPFDEEKLEGEFGKVFTTKKISHITDIPKETVFSFKTFTGTAIPREILTIPLIVEGKVMAVISLASLGKYAKERLEIVHQTWLMMNTAFANQMANAKTRRLAEELQEKNNQLQVQTEELQAQREELEQQSEELQQQNIELEAQRQQIEEANQLKDEFLSNMSHELRTPLNSIMALSHVLLMQASPNLSSEEINYLEIIKRNGKDLLSLINDILDLSKIEAGRMELNARSFSLASNIEGITEGLRPIAQEKGIELTCDVPENMPRIESDEGKVHQILQNIIGNAVKFTEEGQVSVSTFWDAANVHVTISDTGIGIADDDLPYIFDEFRQVNGSSSRKYEGTGLGLSISLKIARLLGGMIIAKSALGKGSTFTFSLPILWQGVTDRPEPLIGAPSIENQRERKTILIIDDDPDIASAISDYLVEKGYHTIKGASGKEGLKLARGRQPFAIILDLIMPDMDGWEVLQNLKKKPETADIPVIIVSTSDDRDTGFALGAVGYVTKPVNKEDLISEIYKIHKKGLYSLEQLPKIEKTTEDKIGNRILLVEDNDAAIIQVKTVLENEGYTVDVARGGAEAIDYVKEKIPDGIILDLMMPGVDGFEVLEKIRNKKATAIIPVLILTAKDLTSDDYKKLSKNNVQQLILKGDIDKEGLLSQVRLMLGEKSRKPSAFLKDEKTVYADEKKEQTPKIKEEKESLTILVVEDNPDNRIAIKSVLKEFNILEATDGEEGLKMALTTLPDLIILDIGLPKMDGLTVVQKIKEDQRAGQIPVIALTAWAMKGEREKVLEAGCDDYISKPINPEKFLSNIHKWLQGAD